MDQLAYSVNVGPRHVSDPNAYGHIIVDALKDVIRHGLQDSLCGQLGVSICGHRGEHDELITSPSACGIDIPDAPFNDFRHILDDHVSDCMTIGVVYGLEMVDVDHYAA